MGSYAVQPMMGGCVLQADLMRSRHGRRLQSLENLRCPELRGNRSASIRYEPFQCSHFSFSLRPPLCRCLERGAVSTGRGELGEHCHLPAGGGSLAALLRHLCHRPGLYLLHPTVYQPLALTLCVHPRLRCILAPPVCFHIRIHLLFGWTFH